MSERTPEGLLRHIARTVFSDNVFGPDFDNPDMSDYARFEREDAIAEAPIALRAIVEYAGITEEMVEGLQVCACSCEICTEWRQCTEPATRAISLLLSAAHPENDDD